MKKVLTTAFVVLMVASTVFAGLSGSANVDLGYNFDTTDYGFLNNGKAIEVKYNLVTDGAEKVGEGAVYAGIKGSLSIDLDKNGTIKAPELGVDEAYVAGDNFKVSILGNAGGVDYAKSAIDVNAKNKPVTYALSYDDVTGVSGEVFNYKFGLGLVGNVDKKSFTTALSFATPKYTLVDGLTLEAGVFGTFDVNTDKKNQAGWGLALAYEKDALKASVASDMGLVLEKKGDKTEATFDADVAANVSYSPVAVDVYYATNANSIKNLLSVKVAADLTEFAPVTVAFTGKDLVNTQDLGAEVGVKLADLKLNATVNGGYNIGAKTWSTGLDVDYTLDDVAKFEAGFGLKGAKELTEATVYAKATNTTLINNATLSLGYESANLIQAKDGKQYGALTASCAIEF